MPAATADVMRRARMASLLLTPHDLTAVAGVVQWFGAMQAQDAASGLWSLGARLPLDRGAVGEAFESAEVVRTWPMRGTIHIVAAEDVRWMLDLTATRAFAGARRRHAQLGLGDRELSVSADALTEAFRTRRLLSRAEALDVLRGAGVDPSGQRGYHVLAHLAHIGLICIGPQRGATQTFALLADWAPTQRALGREDALTELAWRFVRSHGPVTDRDLAGWTGLTLTDARAAIAANDGRVTRWERDGTAYWLSTAVAESVPDAREVPLVVLPGFDEYLLGYKDRSLQLTPEQHDRVVPGGNGVFRATVVHGGRVIATWRATERRTVVVAVEPFDSLSATATREITAALARYGAYLGRTVDVRIVEP
jgi:hypothetical protein